ncbi:aa3-type cytochrome c oxidase subunit IV [Chelativorans sp.]|uniref:aa3-type cytochrome c oxidase subunit IV n=1 Tax=Chelativorans sp. TaxID=2203393 RepID=UPI002811532F|nr:aa3-type cytochrome c oxidase subunit IV [Chelativorans sp.]
MAHDTPEGPAEMGAEMDYAEHERTYDLFLTVTKYTCLVVIATLIAMAFGFFTAAGFISSTILFILICAIGAWFLR